MYGMARPTNRSAIVRYADRVAGEDERVVAGDDVVVGVAMHFSRARSR